MNRLQPFSMPLCNHIYLKMAVIFILTYFSSAAWAQPCDTTFIKRIGEHGVTEQGHVIIPIQDGNIMIGGRIDNASMIMKVTPEGDILWERVFDFLPDREFIFDMFIDSEGMLVGVGKNNLNTSLTTSNYFFRYDFENNGMIWSRTMTSPAYTSLESLLELPNQNFLVYGKTATSSVENDNLMMEVDRASGAKVWSKKYNVGQTDIFFDAIIKNGSCYTANVQRYAGTFKMSPTVSKLDLSGNQIWSRNYIKNINDNARMYASNIEAVGDTLVVLSYGDIDSANLNNPNSVQLFTTDLDGNILWAKQYHIPGQDATTFSLMPVADGYILQGSYISNVNRDVFLIKVDKQGDLVWSKNIGGTGNDVCRSAMYHNGFIYLTIYTNEFDVSNDFLLVKVSADGKMGSPFCSYFEDLQVVTNSFPNPYDGQHNIGVINTSYTLNPISVAPAVTVSTKNEELPGCECPGNDNSCTNLLTNPGFENGLTGWSTTGDATIVTDAFKGNSAGMLCGPAAGSVSQIYPAQEGDAFTASLWAKSDNPSPYIFAQLRFLDGSFMSLSEGGDKQQFYSNEYDLYSLYAAAPANAAYIHLMVWNQGNACTQFDEMILCSDSAVQSDSCFGNVVLTTQADVDAYPGCATINGDLTISGADITDLSPLAQLTTVTGALVIEQNPQLTSLSGLDSLQSADILLVTDNTLLTNIDPLANFSNATPNIVKIENNPNLLSIAAINAITNITDQLWVRNNPKLQSLAGLENLVSVNGYLFLISNDALTNLNELGSLTSAGKDFLLNGNASLLNINGLSKLNNINGDLVLANNDVLPNLNGLENLTKIKKLAIENNPLLENLDALGNLTSIDEIVIQNNPKLALCCGIHPSLSAEVSGPISIQNNLPGCNSQSEIVTTCSQNTCIGDVILESQAEVNAFAGCDTIDGQLVIEGGDITDLTPLGSLKKITGVLVIRNNSNLLMLDGLDNLISIGGLAIVNNPLLQSLLPLSNLSSDDLSPLVFQKNSSMIDLKGLEGITGVRYLSISENSNLTTLEGLNNLVIGKSDFLISHNPDLTNLNGLNSLHTTKEVFGIHSNTVLTDISALAKLTSAYVMAIGYNPSLTNLSGLENLSDLWTLAIVNNDALQNLDAFSSLTSITGDLTIIENPALSNCCGIQPLLNGGSIGGTILIEDNPFACGNGLDVINNCGPKGMDLELSMSQPIADPAQWTTYQVVLTLHNAGNAPASDIKVHFPKPSGVVYSGGNEFTASAGSFSPFGNQEWVVGKLKAGKTVTLQVNYFLLQSNAPIAYAQVVAANEEDIDSTPNNGTPPSVNEDDEANSVDPPVTSACSGDIILNSQAEVNAFGNCEIIDGNLAIVGDDITDLTPLASLTEVKGNLNIWNNINLTSLEGLNNLLSVGGLTIRSNPLLENLLPLSNLSGNELAHLVISKNDSLIDLKGLEGVTGLEQLFIEGNTNLLTLEGLDNLGIAEANVTIWRNPSLLNLNALTNLQSIGAVFTILQNDALSDITALSNLSSCHDLYLSTNPSLLDLSGLENLSGLWDLTVAQNKGLKNLDAFSSLTSINGNLTIRGNQVLTDCCGIQPLLSSGNIGGSINIYLNPFACNNESNILDNCTALVCNGDVILESQAEVDAFSGCSIIEGQLTIRSPFGIQGASSDITDLSPLLSLTKVTGVIVIQNNDELFNLTGLDNITSSNGIVLEGCENISDIQALSGLSGEVNVVWVSGNASLTNIDGLEGITKTNNTLNIASNPVLQNLNGLSGLVEANDVQLLLSANPSLTDIQGLSNLTHVNTDLIIVNCDGLENLNGLQNLVYAKTFVLSSNDVLKDVSAVTSLTNVDNTFFVALNPMLSDCCIFEDLLKSNTIGGSITIENNAPGCNSEQDIESSCGPIICTGDVILESQAEVDAFAGCSVIDGDLIIRSPFGVTGVSSDITDLSPLHSLTEVTGSFQLENNDQLLNLTGLENITKSGTLVILNCDNLNSIQALSGLTGEIGYIWLDDNPALPNLNGLNGISGSSAGLTLIRNTALQNLDGLSNLAYVNFGVEINENTSLTNIQGLSQLTSINGDLLIANNTKLQNLNGLNNITSVKSLILAANDELQDVSALSNLTNVDNIFYVAVNPLLSDCCIFDDILKSNAIGGTITIDDNAPGCNSQQDINDTCQPQGVDLELSMNTSNLNPPIYTTYPVALTVNNTGGLPATGIKIHFPKPAGVVYSGGNEFTASTGSFSAFNSEEWTISSLGAGQSATLTVNYFLLQNTPPVAYAQVIAANEPDTDSTPNNGTPPSVNEDDEASSAGPPPSPKPDLRLSNLVAPATSSAGIDNYNFTLENIGNVDVVGNYLIGAFISVDNSISTDDHQLTFIAEQNTTVGSFPKTGSILLQNNFPPGDYFLILKADVGGAIDESNENNNVISAPFTVAGQICTGDMVLSSQAEVDAFGNCQIIEGNLTIEGADIIDLTPLLPLKEITGILSIVRDSSLTNLTGLQGLNKLGGLIISNNPVLTNITRLKNVTGDELLPLIVENCPALKSLHGLHSITGCNYFRSDNNDALLDFSGLQNLTICRGEFQIMNHASLENLDGLDHLEEIQGPLTIVQNDLLTDLSALSKLQSLSGLFLNNNDTLPSLNGLHNLQSLDLLALANNDQIENVNALSNITSMTTLLVIDNANLSNCCGLFPVLNNNGVSGSIDISGNPLGCNDAQDIITSCGAQGGVDLELSMTSANPNAPIYTSTQIKLTVSNTGIEDATGIKVAFPKPNGTVYTGGNEYTLTQGNFTPFGNQQWTVNSLAAGESATLTVSYFLLTGNALTPFAEVIAVNETDTDSSPNNGTCCIANEDDEAAITLNAFSGGNSGTALKLNNGRQRLSFDRIYPNPSKYWVTLEIYSKDDQPAVIDFYNQQGQSVHRMEVDLATGQNEIEINVSEWRSGGYNIIGRGNGHPAYGRLLKVWEE